MAYEDPKEFDRYQTLATIFTPSTPIDQRGLFRGRIEQVLQLTSALVEPGRHVVLYGERGVGKTSLANVLADFLSGPSGSIRVARFNCNTQDDFRDDLAEGVPRCAWTPPRNGRNRARSRRCAVGTRRTSAIHRRYG